jgi:hypothetical protein
VVNNIYTGTVMARRQQVCQLHQRQARLKRAPLPMSLLQPLVLPSLLVASRMAITGTVMVRRQQVFQVHQRQARSKRAPLPMLLLQSLVLPSLLVASHMAITGTVMVRLRRLVLLRVAPPVLLRVPEMREVALVPLVCRCSCWLDCLLSLLV